MKIVNERKLSISKKVLVLRNMGIGVILGGYFVLERGERENLINYCKKIWEGLSRKVSTEGFVGHIRFDLVPSFKEADKGSLGKMEIGGIYELNGHSPECAAAISVMHKKSPWLVQKQPDAVGILAKVVQEEFGDRIGFLPGNGLLKEECGEVFYQELKKHIRGLYLVKNPGGKEINDPIWRWGDSRNGDGHSEYSQEIQKWLHKQPIVFNTLPGARDVDVSSKDLLNGKEHSQEEIIKEKDRFVLKPLRGSSGTGIIFGRNTTCDVWREKVKMLSGKGYGIFEACWLPKIYTPRLGNFAMDINVSFWASKGDIKYLYTIARIDEWDAYWRKGVINVAKGGGFIGAISEEQ